MMPSEQVTVRSTHVGVAGALALLVLEDDILKDEDEGGKRERRDDL